ncbi:hypothetical protein, partial [Phocaeicola sp.]|uniref:hypothetical protein n=1 Tax=Phocaeicola sp. TaxID=2773926 RepID=UPI00260C6CF4
MIPLFLSSFHYPPKRPADGASEGERTLRQVPSSSFHPPFIGTQRQHGVKPPKADVKGLMPVAERGVRG